MKVKASTIIRIAALFAVLVNQILAIFGKSSFCDNVIYQTVSAVLTVVVSAYAAWKNNDFTKLARAAGEVFDALKDGKMSAEDVENILKSFENPENAETSATETKNEVAKQNDKVDDIWNDVESDGDEEGSVTEN